MIIIPEGSLMIVDTDSGLGMLLHLNGKFKQLVNNDVFICLENTEESVGESIWRHTKVLTAWGVLEAPSWMLRERAHVLVKNTEKR